MKKNHLDEIGIMRAILIISIVLGHAFAIYSGSSSSWTIPEGLQNVSIYKWLNTIFIAFSLQSFVFISGYLMAYSERFGKVSPLKLIKKKASRLILPLLVFGILYLLIIDNSYKDNNILHNIYILLCGPGHLWFLPTLFLCFLGAIIFIRGNDIRLNNWGLAICLCICSLFLPDIMRVSSGCFYFLFFVAGYYCYIRREKINNLNNKALIVGWGLLFLLLMAKIFLGYASIPHIYFFIFINKILLGLTGSVFVLNLCFKLTKYSNLVIIGSWNGFFGVYLFHQFFIKAFIYKTDIFYNANKYVFPIIIFITSITFSCLLSTLFLRNRFLKKII